MKDIILIPTYNERENIRTLIPEIFAIVPDVHILVIDDSSPDGTGLVVKDLMKKHSHLSLLERAAKEGLGAAYKDAIRRVVHDLDVRAVVTMDADGSHDPEFLPEILSRIEKYDFVIGSRYIKGGGVHNWSLWRRILSRGGNLYAGILIGLGIKDLTAGFTATRRELLARVALDEISAAGYAYLMEMKFHCIYIHKASVSEVPIIFKERREGESKISTHIIREGLKMPLKMALRKRFGR